MTPLDPDRTLALSYVPAADREALRALWRLDAAFGAVLAGGREPMISQIKLAWWREALERLDRAPPLAEPVLQALASDVLPRGIAGASLAAMEEGWRRLLAVEALDRDGFALYAQHRGALFFRFSTKLLGQPPSGEAEIAGEAWALVDLARHSGQVDAEAAMIEARARFALIERFVWPRRLRPLGMLAALARRDSERASLERQGSPARMARMLKLWLTGR
jgi:15-cis-phytoene synthase